MKMVDLDLNEPPLLSGTRGCVSSSGPWEDPRYPEQPRCWQVTGTGSLRPGLPSHREHLPQQAAVNLLVRRSSALGTALAMSTTAAAAALWRQVADSPDRKTARAPSTLGGVEPAMVGRARDLPETAPHATSPRPTTQPPTGSPTCADVWGRQVVHGVVNHRRIDGKDGVAGSILAGGSTTNQQLRPGLVLACGMPESREPPLARELPDRFVRCASVCTA
jgi:hypothetical protein